MENKSLLSLDLSTSCTGYAVLDIQSGILLAHGKLKPKVPGLAKMKYPRQQLEKMLNLSEQIVQVIENYRPHQIVIEEIAGSKNRLGQKTLDGLHFIVVYHIQKYLDIVHYYDVTGLDGWRKHLNLVLSDADKEANKEARSLNKKLSKSQQIPIIGPKHLSCRHANKCFNMNLNFDLDETDADIADAVSMGDAFLKYIAQKSS